MKKPFTIIVLIRSERLLVPEKEMEMTKTDCFKSSQFWGWQGTMNQLTPSTEAVSLGC